MAPYLLQPSDELVTLRTRITDLLDGLADEGSLEPL